MRIRVIVTYILICLSIVLFGCASKAILVPNLPEDIGAAGDGKIGYLEPFSLDAIV